MVEILFPQGRSGEKSEKSGSNLNVCARRVVINNVKCEFSRYTPIRDASFAGSSVKSVVAKQLNIKLLQE